MTLDEDLTAFFADFAVDATLQGGGTVSVIFDRGHVELLTGISSTEPQALAVAADVAAGAVNTTLTIAATAYTIRDRRPVDDGALVVLDLQAP